MNLLLICDRVDIREKLTQVLTPFVENHSEKPSQVFTATSSIEGRTLAQEHDCELILLYAPLEGNLGDKTAVQLTELTGASVVVIAPEKIADPMRCKLAGHGVLLATTPLRKHEFFSTLTAGAILGERTRELRAENERLREKLAAQKTVEHAKLLLVECLKLSEEQAHKYIEREAMELRQSRVEVARRIISTYQS